MHEYTESTGEGSGVINMSFGNFLLTFNFFICTALHTAAKPAMHAAVKN